MLLVFELCGIYTPVARKRKHVAGTFSAPEWRAEAKGALSAGYLVSKPAVWHSYGGLIERRNFRGTVASSSNRSAKHS